MHAVRCCGHTRTRSRAHSAHHELPHVARIQRGIALLCLRWHIHWELQADRTEVSGSIGGTLSLATFCLGQCHASYAVTLWQRLVSIRKRCRGAEMLSHAGDTLPCTAHVCQCEEHAHACSSMAPPCTHSAILQDDGLHRHPSQEGSRLEGEQVVSVGGGALLSVTGDDTRCAGMVGRDGSSTPTSGNNNMGGSLGAEPSPAASILSFTRPATPCSKPGVPALS